MFWLLASFVMIFQLPTTSSSLFCIKHNQQLNLSSSDAINTTNCSINPYPSLLCTTFLKIDCVLRNGSVTFDSYNFTDVLNGKNVIKHNMIIGLNDNTVQREFQVFSFKNNSYTDDIQKIYEKSKYSK
jgi:hypothetical protein